MTLPPHRADALAHIRGSGIEIGAYHSPLPVAAGCHVEYVDLYSPEEASQAFPEADNDVTRVVRPQHISPADVLPMFADASLDFVLSSHLFEHLADPIKALKEWHRVLRPDGHLLLIVPDRRYTFDRERPATTVEHVLLDYTQGPDHPDRHLRDRSHYEEWAERVHGMTEPVQIDLWASLLEDAAFPIHFHCWTAAEFRPLLESLAALGCPFEIDSWAESRELGEFVFVARRG